MRSLEFETEGMTPVGASCDDESLSVTLADGRQIRTPLWWYPFLSNLTHDDLNDIELMCEGIWWTKVDEGISVKSMFLGAKARGAVAHHEAAGHDTILPKIF